MDFELTEEQKMLQSTIRGFLRTEYPMERVRKDDEDRNFPTELFKKMADLGWIGLPFPEAYGGSGGTIVDECLVVEELSRTAANVGLTYFLSVCFGGKTIEYSANEEQKQHYLRKLCSGEYKYSLALTEAEGGTDILSSTKTMAVKDGSNFIINGSKMFITGAHVADYLITFARTNKESERKSEGFSIIIVPTKTQGIKINRLNTLGVRATSTNEIFFDNAVVPIGNLFGMKDKGWHYITHTLNNERTTLAAVCVGMACGAFDSSLQYSKERTAFKKPVGQFQAIQHYLADLSTDIDAARLLVYRAAWRLTQGDAAIIESAKAKMFASEVAVNAATKGMRILGGAGYLMESDMQRFYRDSILFTFAPVTNEMCKNLIGEMELGLPRAY